MATATAPMTVDALADATPPSRDRSVDFLRAVAIGVVVLWHLVLSVTHWTDGRLTMPNPIGDVPGLWAATWLFQVMPLFFVVGGVANRAAWTAARRDGRSAGDFVLARLRRLARPVALFVGAWAVFEVVAGAVAPGYPVSSPTAGWSSCPSGSSPSTPAWWPWCRSPPRSTPGGLGAPWPPCW